MGLSSRPLGAFERAQYLTGEVYSFNLVICVHLGAALSEPALASAWAQLQRRHPLLRSAIRSRRGGPVFELIDGAPPVPLRTVERSTDAAWRGEVEAELARPFDATLPPLARCAIVSGRERQEVIVTLHHAIVDAVAAIEIVSSLLRLAAGAVEPPLEIDAPDSLPESADARWPARFRSPRVWWPSLRFMIRQLADEIGYRRRTRGRRHPPPEGPYECRILPLVYGRRETNALVRATRRAQVGVWSALTAAMLLAVARHRYAGSPLPHRFLAFPLLRPYLEPPVSGAVVAGYFSIVRLTTLVDPAADLWSLASAIHRLSDAAAKRGEKFLSARFSELSVRGMLRQKSCRMATAALNYAGAVELPSLGAAGAVDGLRAFVSNFPRGPEYTAQARIFRGRLHLDILYLDCDMNEWEAAGIAEEMRRLLTTEGDGS